MILDVTLPTPGQHDGEWGGLLNAILTAIVGAVNATHDAAVAAQQAAGAAASAASSAQATASSASSAAASAQSTAATAASTASGANTTAIQAQQAASSAITAAAAAQQAADAVQSALDEFMVSVEGDLGLKADVALASMVVRWNSVTKEWEPRNQEWPFGVLYLSTNDPDATAPTDPKHGDRWLRYVPEAT